VTEPSTQAERRDLETFDKLLDCLALLEKRYVSQLEHSFVCPPELQQCITGEVQFGAIDPRHRRKPEPLPVVVIIGINYTQNETSRGYSTLRHYLGSLDTPLVTDGLTRCVTPTSLVIAAYNRNMENWVNPRLQLYNNCDIIPYGASKATLRSGLTDTDGHALKDGFHLIVTNFCPFITTRWWQDQADDSETSTMLLDRCSSDEYLDDLYEDIGKSVDLWIGRAAKDGTRWVWPRFMKFVYKHEIKEWLLTPNINGPRLRTLMATSEGVPRRTSCSRYLAPERIA